MDHKTAERIRSLIPNNDKMPGYAWSTEVLPGLDGSARTDGGDMVLSLWASDDYHFHAAVVESEACSFFVDPELISTKHGVIMGEEGTEYRFREHK